MAANVDNGIEVIAHLPSNSQEAFRQIWHLEALRIAKTDDGYWLKGFSTDDLKNAAVRSIVNLRWFELKDQYLYVKGNRVPERKAPSGLLWHPIQQAFRIDLPSYNENLFDVQGKLDIELTLSTEEQETAASIVKMEDLLVYVDTVPQHFYNALSWCQFGNDQAILVGSTVLTFVSRRFWKYKTLLIPVGYDFKHHFFKDLIIELQQKSGKDEFWIFNAEGYHFALKKEILVPLNRSSVKTSHP